MNNIENTMTAADLHRIVSDALLFAGKDDTLPALCSVQLKASAGYIVATATDRYTAGVARADYGGEPFEALFKRTDLVNLVRMAKTPAREAKWRGVELAVARDESDVVQAITFTFTDGSAMTVKAMIDVQFPSVRKLFPSADTINDSAGLVHVGISSTLLARFDKVSGNAALHIAFTADNKPVVVRKGDNFVGLIMPARLGDMATAGHLRPEWMEL